MTTAEIIAALGLSAHFEGGYFRETYRSPGLDVPTAHGPRGVMSSIYYMLTDESPVDHFHTKHSTGIQYHHLGAPLTYHMIHPDGRYERVVLGPDIARGQQPSLAVAGGVWKAAELTAGDYGLVSEVVAPAWDMADMIPIGRAELLAKFPQHHDIIVRLTPAP